MNIFSRLTLLLFLSVMLAACDDTPKDKVLEGETMGTYFRITVVDDNPSIEDVSLVRPDIDRILLEINQSLSTWDQNSLISRFNADIENLEPFIIDKHFAAMMRRSMQVFLETGGAFNPALQPLVEMWGFGKSDFQRTPDALQIEEALRLSDFRTIEYDHEKCEIQRRIPGVTLNFSAIAKGYAVDVLTLYMLNRGYKNFLIDIGGEIYARGFNTENKVWGIGVEKPSYREKTTLADEFFQGIFVDLHNAGIATSGDYRNFRVVDSRRIHHIIDPRRGSPTSNRVASASVVASNTAYADAWATALMVMGRKGIAECTRLQIACMVQIAKSDFLFEKSANTLWLMLERERASTASDE